MSLSIKVKAGPQQYIHEPGVLQQLPHLLRERRLKRLFIVHGEKSLQAAHPYLPTLADFTVRYYRYNGECTLSEIERIASLAQDFRADALIAIGGGKVIDLTKAAAAHDNKPEILIPTLASNCAAVSAVSIVYDDRGIHVKSIPFSSPPHLVLVEPDIILQAPLDYFIAGIGDTLAKWYEGRVRLEAVENRTVPLELSYTAAEKCRDILFEYAEQAVHDAKIGILSTAFIKVTDANILVAGLVGGFGGHLGKSVGAHSFFNAATVVPEIHSVLHGSQVAYGILVQLALEQKADEIEKLLLLYRAIGLPSTLADIHLDKVGEETLAQIAERMAHPENRIHALPQTVTAHSILRAIAFVEEINNRARHRLK